MSSRPESPRSPESTSQVGEHDSRNDDGNAAAHSLHTTTSERTVSDDDEEEEVDDDGDEDDDEEPALKYERLSGAATEVLEKDSASALAVHNQTLVSCHAINARRALTGLQALGTHNGVVHIFDLTGKRTKSYRPHSSSVLDICIDSTGDFVATASMDGTRCTYARPVQHSRSAYRSGRHTLYNDSRGVQL